MMKKAMAAVAAATLFAGVGGAAPAPDKPVNTESKKVLIAYFSRSGNTKTVAQYIAKATGGDVFEIVPVKPYPEEYRATTDQARKEIDANFRPELRSKVEDITKYEVIFIGSPIWWSTVAPPVASFLAGHDFKGKIIIPFVTHEGSRSGRSVADIKKLCPRSTVFDSLAIRGGQVRDAGTEVAKWVDQVVKIR